MILSKSVSVLITFINVTYLKESAISEHQSAKGWKLWKGCAGILPVMQCRHLSLMHREEAEKSRYSQTILFLKAPIKLSYATLKASLPLIRSRKIISRELQKSTIKRFILKYLKSLKATESYP